jgi:hypothetical protein
MRLLPNIRRRIVVLISLVRELVLRNALVEARISTLVCTLWNVGWEVILPWRLIVWSHILELVWLLPRRELRIVRHKVVVGVGFVLNVAAKLILRIIRVWIIYYSWNIVALVIIVKRLILIKLVLRFVLKLVLRVLRNLVSLNVLIFLFVWLLSFLILHRLSILSWLWNRV